MKTLNRRLLVTSGLFVALCGLTSFNPFTESTHLSALAKEGSITLAQNSANRTAERSGGDAQHISGGLAGKIKTGQQQNPRQENPEQKPSEQKEQPEVKKDEDKKQTSAGVTCPDGKDCSKSKGVLAEILAKTSVSEEQKAEIIKALEEKGVQASREDDEELETIVATIFVGDGSLSYRDLNSRIKCFEKESRGLKKKSQKFSDLKDSMRVLFDDIITSDLKQAQKLLSKLLRPAKIDRQLTTDIKVALKDYEVQKEYASYERATERSLQDLERVENDIQAYSQHLQSMGVNPQFARQFDSNYQNMMSARESIVKNISANTAKLQHVFRQSVPKESENESSYISQLRESRASDYEDLISPVSEIITDKRLVTLDMNATYTNTFDNNYQNYSSNGQSNNGVWSNNGQNNFANNGQNYNSMDPMGVNQRPLFPNQLRTGNFNNMNNNFAMNNNMNNFNTNMPIINNNGSQMPNNMTSYPRN